MKIAYQNFHALKVFQLFDFSLYNKSKCTALKLVCYIIAKGYSKHHKTESKTNLVLEHRNSIFAVVKVINSLRLAKMINGFRCVEI